MIHKFFQVILYLTICNNVFIDCTSASSKKGIWTKESVNKCLEVGGYIRLIKSGTVIIDKTLLAKAIVDIDKKIILITCPRKWGKTVNLEMLTIFFRSCVSSLHADIPPYRTAKYKLFKEGIIYMDALLLTSICKSVADFDNKTIEKFETLPLIAKHEDFVENYLGRYPVLFLTWFKATSYQQFLSTLEYKVRGLFHEHGHILTRLMMTMEFTTPNYLEVQKIAEDVEKIKVYSNPTPLNETFLEDGLFFLSKIIHQYLNKPVFIFVDDWIAPLQQMLYYTRKNDDTKIMKFLTNFVRKTFVENNYIKKAVLCGTLSIDKQLLFDDFADIAYFNVFDNHLQEFYGVTRQEAESLFDYFRVPASDTEKALKYYDGYKMKRNSNQTVYNVWSIVHFLNSPTIIPEWNYWIKSGSLGAVESWFFIERFRHIWKSLVNGDTVLIEYTDVNMHHKDTLFRITNIWGKNNQTDQDSINLIFSFLFEAGYLTVGDPQGVVHNLTKTSSERNVCLRIPNQEIKQYIIAEINKIEEYQSKNTRD